MQTNQGKPVKYWQSRKLIKLEKIWYEKLRDSGFVDAEKVAGKEKVLVQRASNAYRQASETERESKADYFRLLCIYGHDEIFPDKITEIVMLRRSFGRSLKEIHDELKLAGIKEHQIYNTSRQTIRFIIRSYENKWGIRKWTKAQLINPSWRYRKSHLIK